MFKVNNSNDLLYSTWNSAQCYVAAWTGGEFRGELYMYVYVCMAESLCCSAETITTLFIGYIPIQNKKVKNTELLCSHICDYQNHLHFSLNDPYKTH